MRIEVGTEVSWVSAAGYNEGVVTKFVLDKNAAGGLIPWITIKGKNNRFGTTFAATESYLKMMKVTVLHTLEAV